MKSSSIILLIITVLANVVLIISVVKLRKQQATVKFQLENHIDKVSDLRAELSALKTSNHFQFESNQIKNKIQIDTSIIQKTLVIRVHKNDCNDCITHSIKVIQKAGLDKKIPIIICADFPDIAAFRTQFFNIQYPVVIQKDIITDFEGISKPYMFMYDPISKTSSNFIYPHYKLMDVFGDYVSSLYSTF